MDQPEADIVLNAAMKACDPKVGLMLDYRACERKFNLDRSCARPPQTAELSDAGRDRGRAKVLIGPVDRQDEQLYPGGYPLGSAPDWNNGTSELPLPRAGRHPGVVHHRLVAVLRVRNISGGAPSARRCHR